VPQSLRGGRSNHVWYLPGTRGLVLKLFDGQTANPMFANEAAREISSLTSLAGTGLVPRHVEAGSFEGRNWVIYDHVTGKNWTEDTAHAARLLGRLHDQPIPEGLPGGPDGSRDWAARTCRILDRCTPENAR
jgi:fructosamine-3-kinase